MIKTIVKNIHQCKPSKINGESHDKYNKLDNCQTTHL